jgi:5'-methylthioadenosine phosphorylase
MTAWVLGVIGGSGLYEIEGLRGARWEKVDSPFGEPSDALLFGSLDALKRAGCTDVVSLSAVGSLREALEPGDFVIVDQYIDRTFAREKSFFGPGLAAHVSMAEPVCSRLSALVARAARGAGARVVEGGCYLAMEGPQFSTQAESALYRSWGCDVIGMTNMPEAKLAREAELPYASVAMVTDYDCWHEAFAPVDVNSILTVLGRNADRARKLVRGLAELLPPTRSPSPVDTCLDGALITAPGARDPRMVEKLAAVAGRVLRVTA